MAAPPPAPASPSATPEPPAPPPATGRRRWPWWKRLLVGFGVLLLLLALCYRPIVFGLAHFAVGKIGAKQGLKIEYEAGGSIVGGLNLKNVHVTPTRPGPLERADLGELQLRYRLPALVRGGVSGTWLSEVVLKDAHFVYDPNKEPPPPPKKKEAFQLPPIAFPGRVILQNVNVEVRPTNPTKAKAVGQATAAGSAVPAPLAPAVAQATTAINESGLVLSNLNLELDPARPGRLHLDRLRIPGGPDLKDVNGNTTYQDRHLVLTDVTLDPNLRLRRLDLDASQIDQQLLALSFDADAFAGRATARVRLEGLGRPPAAHVELNLDGISLGAVRDFLKLDAKIDGRVDRLALNFDGQSDRPKTWTGTLELHASDPQVGPAKFDRADARLVLANALADLQLLEVAQAANLLTVRANAALPENIADLPGTGAKGDLQLTAPDLASLPVPVPPKLGPRGELEIAGPFALADHRLTADLTGRAQHLAIAEPDAGADAATFTLHVGKTLSTDATAPAPTPNPPPAPDRPWFDGLETRHTSEVRGLRYGPYVLDVTTLAASTDGPAVRVEKLDVARGVNRIHAEARYALPAPGQNAARQPLAADLRVDAPDLSQLSADLRAEPLAGRLTAKGHVESENGAYRGGLDLQARDVLARGLKVQSADALVGVENSVATLQTLRVRLDERNGLDASGSFGLDAPHPFKGELHADLPDLARLEPALRANGVDQAIAGSLGVSGNAEGRLASAPDANDQLINGSLDVTAQDLVAAGVRVAGAEAKIVVQNNDATIQTGQIRFDEKNVVGLGGKLSLNGARPFEVRLNADLPNLAAFEPTLRAHKFDEPIAGSARLEFRADGRLAAPPPADAPVDNRPGLQVRDGALVVVARDVALRGNRVIQNLDGRISLDGNRARVQTFVARFDDKNTVSLEGQAALAAPFDYQAALSADLTDLRTFQPLLRALNARNEKTGAAKPAVNLEPAVKKKPAAAPPKPSVAATKKTTRERNGKPAVATPARTTPPEGHLAGAVKVRWQGEGAFGQPATSNQQPATSIPPPTPAHTGTASVTARGVEFNALGPADADLAGRYAAPEPVEVPTFSIRLNGLELRATLALNNGLLRLDNLHLVQNGSDLLAGYAQIPFRPGDPAGIIPDVDAIDVNIASKPIELTTLFALLDKTQPAPALGTLTLTVNAHGSLSKILADVRVQGRNLRPAQSIGLEPATLDLDLNLRDDRLNLVASLTQPQLKALEVKGNVPLNLNAVLRDGRVDPRSPVQLTIVLAPSNLGFLAKLNPQVAYVDGTASADVRVGGTLENPTFTGAADLNVAGVRAKNITFPRVSDLIAHLAFTERQLRFEKFGGNVGGGRFDLGGRVDFAKLTAADAKLDLSLRASDVLAFRDDNVTARVNADVRVAGPLNTASVTGTVGLTKSRFLKDIDIIPINLPGRPAPAPPAAAADSGPQTVSIDVPPVRDWKFNLVIRTDDPFLVRGNLANGQALVNLKLEGTGAKPLLSGYVTLENLTATLPFSRLNISNGNIQFTPDQPFNPVLDLRGVSEIRERTVNVYIYGRARDPKTLFTSEPPLPQEQIVSLLATGATTEELTGNSQALAGKATLLVLQDLYRRNFKKKTRASSVEPEPSLLDRVDLDVGNVDPRTGKQEVRARFKLDDHYQFIGDLGLEGDLRGRLRYLLRFR